MNPVTIPVNTSRLNDYTAFDRGLFRYSVSGVDKYARVAKATWFGKGDSSSPGILTYQIETFRRLPLRYEDLALYSEGVSPIRYNCITRNLMDTPVVIEAFAIASFIKGNRELDNASIEETHRVAEMVLSTTTNRAITSMSTTFEFDSSHNRPLHFITGAVQYTANYNNTPTSGTILITDPSISTVLMIRKANI